MHDHAPPHTDRMHRLADGARIPQHASDDQFEVVLQHLLPPSAPALFGAVTRFREADFADGAFRAAVDRGGVEDEGAVEREDLAQEHGVRVGGWVVDRVGAFVDVVGGGEVRY